ncbi:MAG: Cysteine desulfurase [candidate division WS6 bacterium 34_10]|uniref:cysteine desulfurase n=1 Tax=candidate division WS6 bacterium 34_10 TaxID=1641389 RepID=A0A101HHR9_9BACT|nr:MAG: Cysteine desulfurase [candidate division WS6 bacterium 34_10]
MKKSKLKKQFPILNQKINGKDIIYLDNAATTQKPQAVIDSLVEYYSTNNANIHRSSHQLAKRATEKWIEAHKIVADFLNASTYEEIIFTRNSTEGLNLFVSTFGKANLTEEDTVIITEMEHHSNIVPWQILQKEIGFNLEYIPVTDNYELDIDWLKNRLDTLGEKVKIVSLLHVSNVLGTINDIKKITELAHEVGAVVMLDAAQSVARLPVDVKDIGCDALVFSGHKIYGPTGIGALYVKRDILEKMQPYMAGGEMIKEVYKNRFTLNNLPWRFEAGTPDIADGIVLGKTLEWFKATVEDIGGYEELIEHERELVERFLDQFEGLEWFKLFGKADRVGAIAFNLEGFSFSGCKEGTVKSNTQGKEILDFISSQGLCIRDGFHCAQPLHEKFKKGPTMRVSLGIYTDEKDIDKATQIIKQGVLRFM